MSIFVATCAMKINFGLNFTIITTTTTILVVFLGHLIKMIAYTTSSLFFKIPLKDAMSLAILLNCKGVVEVAMYSSALDKNVRFFFSLFIYLLFTDLSILCVYKSRNY